MGSEQYYCWDCCIEFNTGRGAIRIYHLDADGELIAAATQQNLEMTPMELPATQRR